MPESSTTTNLWGCLAVCIGIAACSSSSAPRTQMETQGTLSGLISGSRGGVIANAQVTVTPIGGAPAVTVMTNSAGQYTAPGVVAGAGTVVIARLPSTCATTDSVRYSGLVAGQSLTVNATVPCTFATAGTVMWVTDPGTGALDGFSADQLATGGVRTPATIGVSEPAGRAAFDAAGNLWVVAQANGFPTHYVNAYSPNQLTASGTTPTPTVSIELADVSFIPTSIAFGSDGTLWIDSDNVGTLYGYSADQLTASGNPTPAHALQLRANSSLLDMAFDSRGDLWIAGQDMNTFAGFLLRVTAAQLGAANGPVTPMDSLLGLNGTTSPANPPRGVAFDVSGNLWVSGASGGVVMFTKDALASLGGAMMTLQPAVRLVAPQSPGQGLAFDAAGNLWVARGVGISTPSQIVRYPAAALAVGGSGLSDLDDSIPDLAMTVSDIRGILFVPPSGLPLYGLARH